MTIWEKLFPPGQNKAPAVVQPERVVEIDYDEDAFANAVEQAETIRRHAPGRGERRQPIAVEIVVSDDGKLWRQWEVFDRGARTSGVRLPSERYLLEVARRAGARYARSRKRATI